MRRIIGKNPDEGITPVIAIIIVAGIIATGYFTTQAIYEWNKPAVESVKSTAPLNAGIGYLLYQAGSHWMLTLGLLLLTVLIIAHMKYKRGK